MVEKERQSQHVDYLKDAHKSQIANMEQLHAENCAAINSEWKIKFDDLAKRSKLELDLQRDAYDQKFTNHKQQLETAYAERSKSLEDELREKVRVERDLEIERAVDRIEKEMENARRNAEQSAQNRVERVQEKMQKEIENAERAEADAMRKYTETKGRLHELTEELMGEKHKLNLTAVELNQKEERLSKLLAERFHIF